LRFCTFFNLFKCQPFDSLTLRLWIAFGQS
jgi:hypothetical protein